MIARAPRSRGFTMVEVLMAITLLLGVATALWRSMQLSFDTTKRVSEVNERYHEGRQIINRLARELRMAYLRADVPEFYREEDPKSVTRFKGTEDEVYFATSAHLRTRADAYEADTAEVHYFLKPESGSPYRAPTLYRRESTRVDDKPERGGHIWPVLQGVKAFKVEYWDDRKEVGEDAWQRDWDSNDNSLLPRRVRVILELEPPDRIGKPIRFVAQASPRIRRPVNAVSIQVGGGRVINDPNAAGRVGGGPAKSGGR
jgi:type II secretion system protein J